MKNRRKYKRIVKSFISWLMFMWRRKHPGYPNGWDMVTIRDLGAGGILFNYDQPVAIGTNVRLRIIFPFLKKPIHCIGKVMRNEEVSTYQYPSIYRIATEFEKIKQKDKELIKRRADKLY